MAAPKNARGGRGRRWYMWQLPDRSSTERYWSVTTIINGGIPKPALIGWAAKMTAIYAIDNLQVVTSLIDKCGHGADNPTSFGEDGKPTCPGCMDAYELLSKARFKTSKKAADLGTYVHEVIEALVKDAPLPKIPDDVAPYMDQFVEWFSTFEPKFELIEASVYNRQRRYAGTLDGICVINGERWLVDVKTGGVWPEAALQMAAYANAEFVGMPDGTEAEMPPVDRAAVVNLREDGFDFIPVSIDKEVFDAFLYAREVFRFQEEISKNVIGHPVAWPKGVGV